MITGASAAALGRYLLAIAFPFLSSRLPERSRKNLNVAKEMVERSKGKTIIRLALFALSPLPSAQLFEAAGLLRVRLLPFTAAFFTGRLASYSIYASTAAKIRETSIGDAFRGVLSQPLGIALQVLLIAMLVGLARVDLSKWLSKAPHPRR